MNFIGKAMMLVASIFASETVRAVAVDNAQRAQAVPASGNGHLAGASAFTYGSQSMNYGQIAYARARNRRAKGVNRHRDDRTE